MIEDETLCVCCLLLAERGRVAALWREAGSQPAHVVEVESAAHMVALVRSYAGSPELFTLRDSGAELPVYAVTLWNGTALCFRHVNVQTDRELIG